MANDVGRLRRSAVISTFAPGAVVDFRAGGAAISGVVAGLEEWDASFKPAGLTNPQRISEPRLERKLGVRGFRLPPVAEERRQNGEQDPRRLVAVRFPEWLLCPSCDRIAPARKWSDEPGRAPRSCPACSRAAPGGRKVFAVPVRFVLACDAGHLDEFPWHFWVTHKPGCSNGNGALQLKSERPGLAGLFVRCPECAQRRSLDGVFSEATWKERNATCRGRKPWLSADEADRCDRGVRAVQRGASNLYFPLIESSLSIPAWSDRLQEVLGIYWQEIVDTLEEDRPAFIKMLARGTLKTALDELQMTPDDLSREIARRVHLINETDVDNLRADEYRQFTLAAGYSSNLDKEFETRVVAVPKPLQEYFSRIVRVVRLREVRALRGFTRINPSADAGAQLAPISRTKLDWLPAIEVRGEGVFLEFSSSRLDRWDNEAVKERAVRIDSAWKKLCIEQYGAEPTKVRTIGVSPSIRGVVRGRT